MSKMKVYMGFSRDHSGSMDSIKRAAARDYNTTIADIKTSAEKEGIDTIVTVIQCGVRYDPIAHAGYRYRTGHAINFKESVNSSVSVLQPLNEYEYKANGQTTPLFDSVGELIDTLEKAPDANDPEVTFLVQAITDGDDNDSIIWNARSLSERIKKLQATDRWTFVFRVPRGNKRDLENLGIPGGNIFEWEQSERGMAVSTQATSKGMSDYYTGRTQGRRSTQTFYTDIKDVSISTIKANLDDISRQVNFWTVNTPEEGETIRGFCNKKLGRGKDMKKGSAFYQLIKPEDVQDYKVIAIVDKTTTAVYSGPSARDLLGLPQYGSAKVAPGEHGKYDIFIQSTSVNRKLLQGTKVMYWDAAGTSFKS
jgi:hypothetical protein